MQDHNVDLDLTTSSLDQWLSTFVRLWLSKLVFIRRGSVPNKCQGLAVEKHYDMSVRRVIAGGRLWHLHF
jgi:hypothetical protein